MDQDTIRTLVNVYNLLCEVIWAIPGTTQQESKDIARLELACKALNAVLDDN